MAENPQQVLDFLTNLAKRACPQGEKELAAARFSPKLNLAFDQLQPWDIAYYSEKQKQHLYSVAMSSSPYFPENKRLTACSSG
ncbi:M3 family metallopeptidase [Shigella flexneri]